MVACVLQQALDLVKQYLAVSHRMPPYATQKRRVSVCLQNAAYISGIAALSAAESSLLPFTVLYVILYSPTESVSDAPI